ncbi:uncharacterized protein N7511_005444 [Penicillium nucicola]|uniref:uncharacterized protein n=1 Tax=Penicillium nucicola TaxID=1850975 RepID=UPI002545AD09|nr:uncharacterized protein N7511_005444 [Penicillium nucicola]KAJ5762062.1 hypothetical protein N7511_005444 [Penicillium nucicola]
MSPRKQRRSHSKTLPKTISHTPPPKKDPQTAIRETTPQRYGRIEEAGAIRQKWIENPKDKTCTISPSTLSVAELKTQGWKLDTSIKHTPMATAHNLVNPRNPKFKEYQGILLTNPCPHKGKTDCYWILLAEGVIYAKDIDRHDGPPFSEIATALYKAAWPIESLGHVYFENVINFSTRRFVQNRLYMAENGLDWPSPRRPNMVWRYDTPEYQGLLGTRLGRAVAYIVLGAFPRGTRYISKILTYTGRDYGYALHLRFDIELIPVGLGLR